MRIHVSTGGGFPWALFSVLTFFTSISAWAQDDWWNEAFPYRVHITVPSQGTASVQINFTALFQNLGLNTAILDVRSLRVVAYQGSTPLSEIAHDETLTTLLENADDPQLGWSSTGVYWTINDGVLARDTTRFSEGAASLKAQIENWPGGYGYPGVEFHIASGEPLTDWSSYEAFLYDVWPEVNESALDQAPDLYWFKLYNTSGCGTSSITKGGPAVALDQWNFVSSPLKPFHTCTTPNFNDITRLEFHTRDNETVNGNSGLWDDGDILTLWLDNLRLLDQDGTGKIFWETSGFTSFYLYFDTLNHEGHPLPLRTTLSAGTVTGITGAVEAGGYFAKIQGAATGGLQVWSAPCSEKILKTQIDPSYERKLKISAAKGEHEPFQIIVKSPGTQSLSVSISDFMAGPNHIDASNVQFHRVDYVTLTQLSDDFGRLGDWPDPLYPIAPESSVSFPSGTNQPLWVTIHIPGDAVAGIYSAILSIGSATVPVTLEVWDFSLPPEIHLKGEWGFSWSNVVEVYKGTIGGSVQPCYWDLVDALYEDFAEHRLTPKGVGWPAGLNYPGGVEYDCNGNLAPEDWGIWGFQSLSEKYLQGNALENQSGFPSFLIKGPSSNWPPDSRPSSFCGQSRGTDPPGNTAYNQKWFQYWASISSYLENTFNYDEKGYYHIVNEPQTFGDYDIVAYLAQNTKAVAPHVKILVSEQVEPYIYDNSTYPGAKIDIWMPTISNYQPKRAQDRQLNFGEEIFWYFLYGDRPPLPNPTIIDRPGVEARIIPWLAWLERIDGLVYYSITDWNPNPWTQPWLNDANGDGFMLYPPKDSTIAYNACVAQSNRLVPSIRWELLRDGMEDYEYLWLLNGGKPSVGESNASDDIAKSLIESRTKFSRVPTDLEATRTALAHAILGPQDLMSNLPRWPMEITVLNLVGIVNP